ncbi:FAD-dependent oxidoreductase [Amycolatopsis sp. WAC 04197]|uniref:FAD-dependent oxidoreductase n=1 Tax=Amycolatopsis sp. WAC 04197 TaxID=2203199 RepID=UPI000F78E903|nr:FAD-dependent monooxygenase [Amycolatopsis sp. WAC 04197]RSN45201.1 FAD-dependent oxidoreductase [Amycolatopsis sp. WAC 04197]
MARVLIAGGGIAGTVAAIALHETGHEPVIHEAYARTAEGAGAFLALAVNGLDALAPLGLKELVEDWGLAMPRIRICLGSGREVADLTADGRLPDGTARQTLRRSDLYVGLRDEAVRRGIEIRYGRRLAGARETADGVLATFEDGSSSAGDLLVGADGLRSRVRRIIDPQAPPPRYVPMLNTGGLADGLRLDDEPGVMQMTFGKRLFFAHVVHPDGGVWWFTNLPWKQEPTPAELAAMTGDAWREDLIRQLAVDRTPAAEIVRATHEVFPPWATYDFPSVPVWRTDRMVIIGDAAHATSPAAGQGASMAIEDAVTLARCLRDVASIPEALAVYEELRRERVEAVVERGKRIGYARRASSAGRVIRDFLITRAFRKPPEKDPNAFMWQHRIDWESPVR